MTEERTPGKPGPKKDYDAPKIVYTEAIEGRASNCTRMDDATCGGGVLNS